jgi:hypothetical protein
MLWHRFVLAAGSLLTSIQITLAAGAQGPEWLEPHPNRTEGTMFSFRSLNLKINPDTKYGSHKTRQLAHRFDRLRHAHSNPDLWHFVKGTCAETWSATKPDDHHFAATVDIYKRVVKCWSGYHASDVIDWQTDDGYITYLPEIEALGGAPRALWFTDKWDVHHHGPYYLPGGHDPAEL